MYKETVSQVNMEYHVSQYINFGARRETSTEVNKKHSESANLRRT